MKIVALPFTPSKNQRLNELVGFLLFVIAVLIFLALVSYSPGDPSLDTIVPDDALVHNWIGMAGAMGSDLALQLFGVGVFALPITLFTLALRWFRSQKAPSPVAKLVGILLLMGFSAALLGLLPGHLLYKHTLPIEGLAGRIFADTLQHYLNVAGATIVCLSAIAVGLYLSTAFSLSEFRLWGQTRFAYLYALKDRFAEWRAVRAKVNAQKKLEKQRVLAAKQAEKEKQAKRQEALVTARPAAVSAAPRQEAKTLLQRLERVRVEPEPEVKTMAAAPTPSAATRSSQPMPVKNQTAAEIEGEPAIGARADAEPKAKTVLPKSLGVYKLPASSLLHRPDEPQGINEGQLKELAQVLVDKCAEFDVRGTVTHINPGPVVTTYEFKPEAGVKYSKVTGLADDLCLALRAESILIERMAGKSTVGIQVPNDARETIWLREVVESADFVSAKSRLTLAMGKDINGRIVTTDLATMPHMLIAGSTGSGKSVAINAMIMSILYKATPEQVRMILVDPKRVELGNYDGIPHLFTPIITEPKLAANALRNAVREMERRLKLLASKGVRNIDQFNRLFDGGTPSLFEDPSDDERPLPYIVIIIDELADLMMLDQANVEESITRLAQMARAVGIHLVLATQRPSVDVITGLIKANIPTRLSFRVATKIDSRTILDGNGAEALLGRGDLLFLPPGTSRVQRVHAPFVTEKEISAVVEFWRAQGLAQYEQKFLEAPKDENGRIDAGGSGSDSDEEDDDPMFDDAVRMVLEFGKASTSLLQRRLRIGYGRAAHLIDLMERDGIVGPADGPKPREILKRPDWVEEVDQSLR